MTRYLLKYRSSLIHNLQCCIYNLMKSNQQWQNNKWLVINKVWSKSFWLWLVTEHHHDVLAVCAVSHIFAYWTSSTAHVNFSLSSVVSRAFSAHACAMHVFDVWASSPPGYLCAKFRFCHALHCWASPQRKIAYSVNQYDSLTHAGYLIRWKSKLLLQNKLHW